MPRDTVDWKLLARLRRRFLQMREGEGVYWASEADLRLYHAFFAQRIGWKWDDAISQARQAGWQLRSRTIFDWGCGTGIASIKLLESIGVDAVDEVILWDHSTLAANFAKNGIEELYPGLETRIANEPAPSQMGDTLCLASHVLNELAEPDRVGLSQIFQDANQVFFVEPGTYESSRLLMEQREALSAVFRPLAPCVCDGPCPMAEEINSRHWCHFFAKPPTTAFTDPDWGRFSRELEIDLRSLPYSYLALDSRRLDGASERNTRSRVIGRPRQRKGFVQILSCDGRGLNAYELQRRDHPSLWKTVKKNKSGSLFVWSEIDSGRIKSGAPVDGKPS